ncbi:MAG: glycosyltransferase family 4 protein, partial [Tepidisphaeraceae bacterium]
MIGGWEFLIAGVASFVCSLVFTRGMIWLSPRIGFVDKPGHRKIHANPKPLGGGVAIFWSFALVAGGVALAGLYAFHGGASAGTDSPLKAALAGGVRQQVPLGIGFLACALVLHVMGIFDDRRAMGPYLKLFIQLGVTAALVIAMEWLAQTTPSLRLRILTTLDQYGLGPWPSIIVTVLWIGAITNAFNFLDNMDGLSSGVAVICAIAFLVTALSIGQLFVAGTLAVFIGAVLGFLVWNFPPSKIFMGDSGSLL